MRPTNTTPQDLAAYIERLRVGVFRSSRDGRFLFANQALADIFGYDSPEDLLQVHIPDIYVDPSRRSEAIERADTDEEFGLDEHRVRRRDGTMIWVRIHARPIYDSTGRTSMLEGVLTDITEEREVREELAVSEGRFRAAFERSPFSMVLMTPDLEPLAINQAGLKMLGLTPELFKTISPATFTNKADWADAEERLTKLREGHGEGYTVERELTMLNGETKPVIVSVTAVRNSDGSLHSFITQMVDITEQRMVQQTLEALVRSKDELVRSVSHELRTPLTTIMGLSSELASEWDRFDPDERRELIDIIATQSGEMAELVDDLLAAARADVGLIDVAAETVDLSTELAAVADVWERQQITVKYIRHPEPVLAVGDPFRIRQIIRNLLSNAVKYGAEPVVVEARQVAGRAEVSVRDAGDPLPEAQRELIFDTYYRAATSEVEPGSVGLGLAVSRNLARLMGGDLEYRITEDTSDFVFSLCPAPDPT